ncbi:MAG: hypothetical protein GXP25_18335 [Planctomycetes bacterium]|nr:hypothetical protein [Planctomycetota bacterium]
MKEDDAGLLGDSLNWIPALRKTRNGLLLMLRETEGAFLTHKLEQVRTALGLVDGITRQCEELTERVVRDVKNGSEESRSGIYRVRVVGNLGRLAREIAAVTEVVRQKIESRILFSNKAVQELKELFPLILKVIADVFDGIETGNQTLLISVVATAEKIAAKASAAATEHEERLVRGVCQPKSSAVFLDMIYSLRSISHTLKMLVKDVPEPEG